MSDPLDVARLLTGATAAVAGALPEPVRTVVRLLDAGLSLASTLRGAGLDPLASIATMERAVDRYDASTRRGHAALDAALDALGVPPLDVGDVGTADTVPPPPIVPRDGLRSPTAPFGHPAPAEPSEPADGAPEPAGETICGVIDDGPPPAPEVL